MADSKVHVAWRNDCGGGVFELFYKSFAPETTSIANDDNVLPLNVQLSAYPNPFNSTLQITTITDSPGMLSIYDILGGLVREYDYDIGKTSITWDARDTRGHPLSTGVYFIRLKGGDGSTISRKVIYLK